MLACPRCGFEAPDGFAYCGRCGQPLAPPEDAGERRDVTVLFADVHGFTAMSERMDPEEIRDWMGGWLGRFGRVIEEEGGHVDKYMGDGLMALFGAPVAHEDDPARACRAALAILRMCEDGGPRVRLGINCGLVVAGSVGSSGAAYTAMGDTVNLASRLEQAAPPGGALVSAAVVRRVRDRFGFGPARHLQLKGKSEPVEARELIEERSVEPPRPFQGPFVGRERALRRILERLRSEDPAALWVEVRGELGIGKTRLAEEALARLPDACVIRLAATEALQRRAYGFLRLILAQVVRHLQPEAPPPAGRPELAHALAPLGLAVGQHLDALWDLAAPSGAPAPPVDPDPRTRARMIESGVAALLATLARLEPRAVLVLDAWERADAGSALLLESLAARPQGPPLATLVLSRPEGRPPIRDDAIVLEGLAREESARLLQALLRGAELPPALRQNLLARAAGVPLHLAEMVRGLAEDGVLRPTRDGGWSCERTPEAAELPATIRAAMVSRLDRVPPVERALLGRCAVQGAEFEAAIAEAASEDAGPPVLETLAELERRDLVVRLDPAGRRWAFRHPLLGESAYELLLLQRRRTLHRATARALVDRAGGEESVPPDVLAHHWERAEAWGEAARADLRAGEVAAGLYLNATALRWYERALEAVERIESRSAGDEGIAVRALAGAAETSLVTGAYDAASARASAMRERASRPAERAEADVLAARALFGRGRTEEAETRLRTALDESGGGDREGRRARLKAHLQMARLLRHQGRTAEALAAVAAARGVLERPDQVDAGELDSIEGQIAHTEGRFGDAESLFDHAYEAARRSGSMTERAAAANELGNVARDRGDYRAARRQFRRALALWRRMGDAEGVAGASVNLANLAMSVGELDTARRHHEEAREACRQIGNVAGTALAWANLAIVALEEEDGPAAVRAAEAALAALGPSGSWLLRGQVLVVLGEACLASGDTARARSVFTEVLEQYDETGHPQARAGAWRGLGRVSLAEGDFRGAVERIDRALEWFERLSREQEAARTLVFRALALRETGDRRAALVELQNAGRRLAAIHAGRDAVRVDELLARWRSEEAGREAEAGSGSAQQ